MNKRDRKALCEYIRWVANEMELRDWRFELMRNPCGDDNLAVIHPVYGQKHATLYVCKNFRELDSPRQREVIAHELVHCHLAALQSQLEDDLRPALGEHTYSLFFAAAKRNIEYATNGLEMAIAKHLPLIEWPTKGTR
jgi:hypothetical protein